MQSFALHKAVIKGDLVEIQRIINEGVDINERDRRGIPALHYAVHLRSVEIVALLLENGADPHRKSTAGWSVMHEAIATKDKAIVKAIMCRAHNKLFFEFQNRLPALVEALKRLPDFYMELKWEFHSWVPLVSRLCPSDIYKVYKKGASFRVDTTLVGFENLKWMRGDLSFLFKSEGGGTLYALNNKIQTAEKIFAGGTSDFFLKPDKIPDRDVDEILAHELGSSSPRTDRVVFSSSKTWLGTEKVEKVGIDLWNAKIFSFEGFEMKIMGRKRAPNEGGEAQTLTDSELRQELLEKCENPSNAPPSGLLFAGEVLTEKLKSFKGTVWLSQEFPRTVAELLPIFQTLAPTQKHFDKLNQFISMKLPEKGFPVKIDIPVFPTISATVTFLTYKEMEYGNELFEIPPQFKMVIDQTFNHNKVDES